MGVGMPLVMTRAAATLSFGQVEAGGKIVGSTGGEITQTGLRSVYGHQAAHGFVQRAVAAAAGYDVIVFAQSAGQLGGVAGSFCQASVGEESGFEKTHTASNNVSFALPLPALGFTMSNIFFWHGILHKSWIQKEFCHFPCIGKER